MLVQKLTPSAHLGSGHICMQLQSDVQEESADTVAFVDSTASYVENYSTPASQTMLHDQTTASDMQKFLNRPVRIKNFTWSEADPQGISITIQPWQLFFSDQRVKNKLNNFAFINCKLKVKFMVNASPFYYGSMGVSYRPLTSYNVDNIKNDIGNRQLIPYSQRPIVWLTPQRNEGAEMTLPFLYPQNWLSASTNADMASMGTLTFIVYTPLQSANGVTGSGVTVSVYAWAEDLKISGPTVSLAVQSDEYKSEPFSKKASALAGSLGKLSDIPVIGKFATAASMGASAVGKIAHLFGYTNVPVIDNAIPMRSEPFPQLSTAEISYPVQKLTLDPKNELTIDKSAIGLENVDELAISKLVMRESYLTSAVWTNLNTTDDLLFSTPVAPCNMWDISADTYPKAYMTPMCWIGKLFQSWRGDIIFRLRIVASKYHKGRLLISFDPDGQTANNVIAVPNTSNAVMTEIVDLDDTNEVEFRVPYQQALPFLLNQSLLNPPNWSTSLTPSFVKANTLQNGWFTVRVLTALTAPVLSTNVVVQVFVRGAENLEFANPTSAPAGWSVWNVQSDVVQTDTKERILGHASVPDEHQYLVNQGENITSIRQLLRRMTLSSVSTPVTATGNAIVLYQKFFAKIPPYFGYDIGAGINSAKGLVATGSNFKFNFTKVTPLNWICPAFVGYRGSVNWTFNMDNSGSGLGHARVSRQNLGSVPFSTVAQETFQSAAAGTSSANAAFYNQYTQDGAAGTALTNQLTNAGLSIQCPMYNNYNFASVSPNFATAPVASDGGLYDMYMLELGFNNASGLIANTTRLWSYVGIGTDFDPVFFLNVPVLQYIANGGVPN